MVVKNKKNGTNILTYREGMAFVRVPLKAKETLNITTLLDFNNIINKQDFGPRGWFEIIEENKTAIAAVNEESALEKAKKEVKEYASDKKQNKEE